MGRPAQLDLFPVAPRRPRRVLMHVMDAGDINGKVIRFECRCGFKTDWIRDVWTISENRRGHPCPKCNPSDPDALYFADLGDDDET